jgi:hypothetical protein
MKKTNMDLDTGIRYTAYPASDIGIDDILQYEYEKFCNICDTKLNDENYCHICEEHIDEPTSYSDEPSSRYIDHDGVVAELDSIGDLIVFKSPWTMQAGLASPCFPNGCYARTVGNYTCYALPLEMLNEFADIKQHMTELTKIACKNLQKN